MDRLEFHINSPTGEECRRLKSRLKRGRDLWSRSVGLPLGGAGGSLPLPALLLCGALVIAAGMGGSTILVNGVPIQGSHILVVEDVSGSMGSSQVELARQKAQFGSSLFEGESQVWGFGVVSSGDDSNLLHVLQHDLPAKRGVDTVYVFSDFEPIDYGIDCNDLAGLDQFRQLIRSAPVRLYLSTVNMLPSSGLLAIAKESGGGLLSAARAQDSLQDRRRVCRIDQ